MSEEQWVVWPTPARVAEWLAAEWFALDAWSAAAPVEPRRALRADAPQVTSAAPPRAAEVREPSPGPEAAAVARRILRWTARRSLDPVLALVESQVVAARRRLGARPRYVPR